ncbi:MAG TPA: hypothetical protein VGD31_00760 [Sphingobacteriaceae bacterium]
MKKELKEHETMIEVENNFSFLSLRRMYLKLLPQDRAKVQFVLQCTKEKMSRLLWDSQKVRYASKKKKPEG